MTCHRCHRNLASGREYVVVRDPLVTAGLSFYWSAKRLTFTCGACEEGK